MTHEQRITTLEKQMEALHPELSDESVSELKDKIRKLENIILSLECDVEFWKGKAHER